MERDSAQGFSDSGQRISKSWDAVENYFECITTCSLDDGDCITRCVEQLRDNNP